MLKQGARRWRSKIAAIIAFMVVIAFSVLTLSSFTSNAGGSVDLSNILALPSPTHPLGTDNLGRDLWWRLGGAIQGAVLPIWVAVMVASLVGASGGWLAIVLVHQSANKWCNLSVGLADAVAVVIASVPVGLAAFAWAAWSERAGLVPVLFMFSLLCGVRTYLQVRDLYRHDERLAYWTAQHALGGALAARVWRYGFRRQWREPLLLALSFHLQAAVAIEAAVAYLGFGIQEPQASFGNMLASHFDTYLRGNWLALAIIVGTFTLTIAMPASLASIIGTVSRHQGARELIR